MPFISWHWLFLRTHSPWCLSQAPLEQIQWSKQGDHSYGSVVFLNVFFLWRVEVKEGDISSIWNLQLSFCCKKNLGCLLSVSDPLQLGYKFSLDVIVQKNLKPWCFGYSQQSISFQASHTNVLNVSKYSKIVAVWITQYLFPIWLVELFPSTSPTSNRHLGSRSWPDSDWHLPKKP